MTHRCRCRTASRRRKRGLPEEVRRMGISVQKSAGSFLLVVHMLSPGGRYDQIYISNYTTLNVRDRLARIEGVGDAQVFGARDYSMRIWLDPEKIASRGLSVSDVLAGLRRQNIQVAAGAIGGEPQPNNSAFELTVEAPGRLVEAETFADVVVATGADGALVRVSDIGRVELGAAGLFFRGPPARRTRRRHRHLPASGLERARDGGRSHPHDGRALRDLPRRSAARDRLQPHRIRRSTRSTKSR